MTFPTNTELASAGELWALTFPASLESDEYEIAKAIGIKLAIFAALIAEAETNPAALSYLVEVDESSIASVSSGNDVADWLRAMKDTTT